MKNKETSSSLEYAGIEVEQLMSIGLELVQGFVVKLVLNGTIQTGSSGRERALWRCPNPPKLIQLQRSKNNNIQIGIVYQICDVIVIAENWHLSSVCLVSTVLVKQAIFTKIMETVGRNTENSDKN